MSEYYYEKYTKEQIAERETDYAFFILEKWKEKYPNSPQLMIAYADVHLLNEDFKKAKKYYKALQKLDSEKEVLKRLLKQLK